MKPRLSEFTGWLLLRLNKHLFLYVRHFVTPRDSETNDHITNKLWLSPVQLFATPWTAVPEAFLSLAISWSSQIHVHWVGDAV